MTKVDMRIEAKSDQLNADDLLTGPRDITITAVRGNDSKEQPVSVFFDGDGGKPYKPCKSMRRVMVHVWGQDAHSYVGKSMRLFNDPKVLWGGMAVGGIRISHMTGITEKATMALTATRGNKKPFTVEPLVIDAVPDKAKEWANSYIKQVRGCSTVEALYALDLENQTRLAALGQKRPELRISITAAVGEMFDSLSGNDPFDGGTTESTPPPVDEPGDDAGQQDSAGNSSPPALSDVYPQLKPVVAEMIDTLHDMNGDRDAQDQYLIEVGLGTDGSGRRNWTGYSAAEQAAIRKAAGL